MHHHITYMNINFQQNWANRSVITVHTNVFAKNRNLSCINLQLPREIFKNCLFQTCIIVKRMYNNFQQNRVRSAKTVHTNLFAKILICINLQRAIRILKNHVFRTCTAPSRTFRPVRY